MKLRVGGVRGSFSVARPDVMRYGGETTSLSVEGEDGTVILLDLGTGVRRLGARMDRNRVDSVTVLITHYHLDHLVGLPSLSLLYRAGSRVEFAAPPHAGRRVKGMLNRFLAHPFWPLDLDAMQARIRFTNLPGPSSARPVRRGGLEIRWCSVHHPAGCTAYRIDEPATGASLVFATDVEWGLSTAREQQQFLRFSVVPDAPSVLLFDAHVRPQEEERYRNWGHSTWRQAGQVGRQMKAKRVLGIHHAPERTDDELDAMSLQFRAEYPKGAFARADQEIAIRS